MTNHGCTATQEGGYSSSVVVREKRFVGDCVRGNGGIRFFDAASCQECRGRHEQSTVGGLCCYAMVPPCLIHICHMSITRDLWATLLCVVCVLFPQRLGSFACLARPLLVDRC